MKIPFKNISDRLVENISYENLSNILFQLGHEHEILDNKFEMEFTPNRGDCLSINGILRDISILTPIKPLPKIYLDPIEDFNFNFENKIKDKCPKISFLEIEIANGISEYKEELGEYFNDPENNKINFFTDVSNYISFETGQPTHCYDATKMTGDLILEIDNGECEFETLIGKKINLCEKNAVFKINNEIINLAGVMGGKNTACSDNTTKAIVECAYFQPALIIGKSVKYGINSDAAYKFERGVDSNNHDYVIRRFINLVSLHADIVSLRYSSEEYTELKPHFIELDIASVNKIIGVDVPEKVFLEHIEKLGMIVENNSIKIPSFRPDLRSINDIAEEISRIIGYDNIKPEEIEIITNSDQPSNSIKEKAIKQILKEEGFYEVINFPFTNKETNIKIDNPLDVNKGYIRTTLKDSLIENLLFNERRQKDSLKFFEISDIYEFTGKEIKVKKVLGIIASGRMGKDYKTFQKKINEEYINELLLKFEMNNLTEINEIPRDNLDTKVKDKIIYLEICLDKLPKKLEQIKLNDNNEYLNILYEKISEYPSSNRDLSFSIKDFSKLDELQNLILSYNSEILKEVFIFDYYADKKNELIKIGFRFIFQSKTGTITDNEVDNEIDSIINSALQINSVKIPGLK